MSRSIHSGGLWVSGGHPCSLCSCASHNDTAAPSPQARSGLIRVDERDVILDASCFCSSLGAPTLCPPMGHHATHPGGSCLGVRGHKRSALVCTTPTRLVLAWSVTPHAWCFLLWACHYNGHGAGFLTHPVAASGPFAALTKRVVAGIAAPARRCRSPAAPACRHAPTW